MSPYLLSPAARLDLVEIKVYLVQHADRAAVARVLGRLRDAMRELSERPSLGHVQIDLTSADVRFYRVFRYMIVYRPDRRPLEVVRVLHGSRDIKAILGGNE